jgi:thiamine-phosphate pyrophosphorylase
MELIVISPPTTATHEVAVVTEMLAAGLARFHVRKPAWEQAEMAAYLAEIPRQYHAQLVLHSHHALVAAMGLGGAHLTAASRAAGTIPRLRAGQTLSTSFHSLAEIRQHRRRYDYVFLSPVFDSISKDNYGAAFDLIEVAAALRGLREPATFAPRVLALGGVDAARLAAVRQVGFAGAALLGAIWQSPDPVAAFRRVRALAG